MPFLVPHFLINLMGACNPCGSHSTFALQAHTEQAMFVYSSTKRRCEDAPIFLVLWYHSRPFLLASVIVTSKKTLGVKMTSMAVTHHHHQESEKERAVGDGNEVRVFFWFGDREKQINGKLNMNLQPDLRGVPELRRWRRPWPKRRC